MLYYELALPQRTKRFSKTMELSGEIEHENVF
jgi:hypothetical protein